ncbi:MAG: type II toxin-antitoxin system HicA family toxin [Patescibacteria group bacterium]
MKRHSFLKHLAKHKCFLFREGKKHSVFYNPSNDRVSTVPRHREIDNLLANKICKDLDISKVK